MVRADTDEPVASEQVERMLRNAVRAPSAGVSQGWSLLVLDTPETMERLLGGDHASRQGGPRGRTP
ncbi:nitroreductase family protein [Georgenia alba]|uniref:Nitroreductase family protein n=1 Tax=Georgenia alba TaxID=2233858 RepID=A0ABW2Q550_9MICO